MVSKIKRIRSVKGRYSAKLTSKYQVTIPKAIRERLHLKSGDQILYELLPDDTVFIRKTTALDNDYLEALNSTMNEWKSDEDERAYKNL